MASITEQLVMMLGGCMVVLPLFSLVAAVGFQLILEDTSAAAVMLTVFTGSMGWLCGVSMEWSKRTGDGGAGGWVVVPVAVQLAGVVYTFVMWQDNDAEWARNLAGIGAAAALVSGVVGALFCVPSDPYESDAAHSDAANMNFVGGLISDAIDADGDGSIGMDDMIHHAETGADEVEERIREAVAKVTAEFEGKMAGLRDMASAAKAKLQEALAAKDELVARLAEFANIGDILKRAWNAVTGLKDKIAEFIRGGIARIMEFFKGGLKAIVSKVLDLVRFLLSTKIRSFLPSSLRGGFENLCHQHWPSLKRHAMCLSLTGLDPDEGGDQALAEITVDDELGGERGAAPDHPEDDDGPPAAGGGGCFGFCSGGGPGITDEQAHQEGLKVFERFSKAGDGLSSMIGAFEEIPIVHDTISTFKSTVGHLVPGLDSSSDDSLTTSSASTD